MGPQQVARQVVGPRVSPLLHQAAAGCHLRGDWSVRRQVKRQHIESEFVTLICRFGAVKCARPASRIIRVLSATIITHVSEYGARDVPGGESRTEKTRYLSVKKTVKDAGRLNRGDPVQVPRRSRVNCVFRSRPRRGSLFKRRLAQDNGARRHDVFSCV